MRCKLGKIIMLVSDWWLQWLVVCKNPLLSIGVKLVLVAIVVDRDELVVKLGKRYAIIAVEFARVCRERNIHCESYLDAQIYRWKIINDGATNELEGVAQIWLLMN